MKIIKNKSGFTLIEIIVVMIIVGILAAIALPNLFNNINTSKGTSALQSADGYKTPIETCMGVHNAAVGTAPCDFATLFGGPSATVVTVGNGFDIDLTGVGGDIAGNDIEYNLVGYDPTAAVAFTLARNTGGTFTCTSGPGVYSTVCQ